MPSDPPVYRRQDLYDQVWSSPIREVAKHYGLSDVALAKICAKLDVPRPPRGHWAKKAVGKDAPRPPLPPLREGVPDEYQPRPGFDSSSDTGIGGEASGLLARERDPAMAITVPDEIVTPHPLITKYRGALRKASKKGGIGYEQACLDIRATGEALDRALRIGDALLKALDQRGFAVTVTDPVIPKTYDYAPTRREITPSQTVVSILGLPLAFAIEEGYDVEKVQPEPVKHGTGRHAWTYTPPPQYERHPNGKLALVIRTRARSRTRFKWADGGKQKVENCLNSFIVGLMRVAEQTRIEKADDERRKQERLAAEIRRMEEDRRLEIEKARILDLERRLAAWRKAEAIREFLVQVEAAAHARGEDLSADSEFGRWLTWAWGHAKRLKREAVETVP